MDPLIATKHALLLEHSGQDTDGAHLVMALLRTAALVDRACGAQLARFDLTEARFAVLLAVARDDSATPAAIADQLDVSRAAVSGLLDGLVRQGLVSRTENAHDRRSLSVALTAAGRTAIDELGPAYGSWLGGLTAGLDPERIVSALDALAAIQRGATAEASGNAANPREASRG